MLLLLRTTHQFARRKTFKTLAMSLSTMQEANRLQKALKKGGPTFGAWQVNNPRL